MTKEIEEEIEEEVVVEEEIIEEEIEEVVEPKIVKKENKGYVKERVEKAKKEGANSLLKELGFNSVEEIQTALQRESENAIEIAKLNAKLLQKEKEEETALKVGLLDSALTKEDAFDNESLISMIDLDSVEVEDGKIKDLDLIISTLKEKKPKFFDKKIRVKTDTYVNGQEQTETLSDKAKSGDIQGFFVDYLKTTK